VCRLGREEECKRVKITESGKLVGAVIGSTIGPKLASSACVAISASGYGAIACAIIMAGVGAVGGGLIGENFGSEAGEKIYEWGE